MGELSSISSDDGSDSDKGFHHPFIVKERPNSIIMNIRVKQILIIFFGKIIIFLVYEKLINDFFRIPNKFLLKRFWKKQLILLIFAYNFQFQVASSIEKQVNKCFKILFHHTFFNQISYIFKIL